MLVIEGTDLVGKTRLARRLLEELNRRELPHVPRHFSLLPQSWDYYWSYLPHFARAVVMDRFYMSEVVYGTVVRGHTMIDMEAYRLLDARLRQVGGMTIIVTADEPVIEERYAEEGKREMFALDQILTVNRLFRQIVDMEQWEFVDFDETYHVRAGGMWAAEDDAFVNMVVDRYMCRWNRLEMLTGANYRMANRLRDAVGGPA